LGLALDEPNGNDTRLNLDGMEVLVEQALQGFLDGHVIDCFNAGLVVAREGRTSCA
jgi:hypothetical protein